MRGAPFVLFVVAAAVAGMLYYRRLSSRALPDFDSYGMTIIEAVWTKWL